MNCYVGHSEDYERVIIESGEGTVPLEIPVPPKLTDCKDHHDVKEDLRQDTIKRLELALNNPMTEQEKERIQERISQQRNAKFCRDDCEFCSSNWWSVTRTLRIADES